MYDLILNQEFDLVYYGHLSYESCETMSTYERRWFHDRLIKQKNEVEAQKGPPSP